MSADEPGPTTGEGERLDDAVGRLVGIAGTIARVNRENGGVDPKHPFFWPDLDDAIAKVNAVLAATPDVAPTTGDDAEETRAFAALQTAMGTLHNEATTVIAGLRAQGFVIRRPLIEGRSDNDEGLHYLASKLIEAIDCDDKPNIHGWSRALAAILKDE